MPFPAIPDILKNTNWQQQKGKFAKIFGRKTGIGEQMVKLKTEYDKLDHIKLNAATTYNTLDEADEAVKQCKAELAKAAALRTQAYALRDLAKGIEEKFAKNKLIPSASTTHVKNVATAADHYGVAVKSYDPAKEFEAAKERTKANLDRIDNAARQAIATAYPKCVAELNKVKQAKPPVWTDAAWQAIRAYAAAVAKWKKLASVQPQWKVLASQGADKVTDVLKHVDDCEKLLATTQGLTH